MPIIDDNDKKKLDSLFNIIANELHYDKKASTSILAKLAAMLDRTKLFYLLSKDFIYFGQNLLAFAAYKGNLDFFKTVVPKLTIKEINALIINNDRAIKDIASNADIVKYMLLVDYLNEDIVLKLIDKCKEINSKIFEKDLSSVFIKYPNLVVKYWDRLTLETKEMVLLTYPDRILDLLEPKDLGKMLITAFGVEPYDSTKITGLISIASAYDNDKLYSMFSIIDDKHKANIFAWAAYRGDLDIFKEFIPRLTVEQINTKVFKGLNTAAYHLINNKRMDIIKLLFEHIKPSELQKDFIKKLEDEVKKIIQIKELEIKEQDKKGKEKVIKLVNDAQSIHHAGNIDQVTKDAFKKLKTIYSDLKTDEQSKQILKQMLSSIAELRKSSDARGYSGPSKSVLDSAEKLIIRISSEVVTPRTRMLIALAWQAASDVEKIVIPEGDSLSKKQISDNLKESIFLQMFEAQNAYGFNSPSCIPGTENRVMTVLSNYYPGISFDYGFKKIELDIIKAGQGEEMAKIAIESKLIELIKSKAGEEVLELLGGFRKGVAPIEQNDSRWKELWNEAAENFLKENPNENLIDYLKIKSIEDEVSIDIIRCLRGKFGGIRLRDFVINACSSFEEVDNFVLDDDNKEKLIKYLKENLKEIDEPHLLKIAEIYVKHFSLEGEGVDIDNLKDKQLKLLKEFVSKQQSPKLFQMLSDENLVKDNFCKYLNQKGDSALYADFAEIDGNYIKDIIDVQINDNLQSSLKSILDNYKNGKAFQSRILATELAFELLINYREILPASLLKDREPDRMLKNLLESTCKDYLSDKERDSDKFAKKIKEALYPEKDIGMKRN
jgi:hypothetical protein